MIKITDHTDDRKQGLRAILSRSGGWVGPTAFRSKGYHKLVFTSSFSGSVAFLKAYLPEQSERKSGDDIEDVFISKCFSTNRSEGADTFVECRDLQPGELNGSALCPACRRSPVQPQLLQMNK